MKFSEKRRRVKMLHDYRYTKNSFYYMKTLVLEGGKRNIYVSVEEVLMMEDEVFNVVMDWREDKARDELTMLVNGQGYYDEGDFHE